MNQPMFFVFDGVDGAGKTTQIHRFRTWLESTGQTVELCRDPGTSQLGEYIRDVLLTFDDVPICIRAEMLLYMAARAQLVEQIIQPALARGHSVISDRYLLANVVYQGHAGGLPADTIWQIGQLATAGLEPTLTLVMDLDPAEAAKRRQGPPDRLERRGTEYFERVRKGFLREAERHPLTIAVIDAGADPDTVERAVQQAARRVIERIQESME
jgi:dTMP kinase